MFKISIGNVQISCQKYANAVIYQNLWIEKIPAKPLNDAQTVLIFIPYGGPRRNHTIPAR